MYIYSYVEHAPVIHASKIMYDIILFGATGFTGKLCAHFIAQNHPSTTQWCIAGRSLSRLEAVVKELKELFPDRVPPGMTLALIAII